MSLNSEPTSTFSQDLCRQLIGTLEALSNTLKESDLSAEQRRRVNAELRMIYREVTQLTQNVAQPGLSAGAYRQDSIGEEWPIIDPRAYQMVNSPLTTAWISNLLSTVVPGLVSGGTRGDSARLPPAGA